MLEIGEAVQSESRGLSPHYPLWARDQYSEKVQPCCSLWLRKLAALVSAAKQALLPWSSFLHSPSHGKQKEKATAFVVITLTPSRSSCPCSGTALPPQPGPRAQPPGLAESVQGDWLDNAGLHCPSKSQQFTIDSKAWLKCCSSTMTWTWVPFGPAGKGVCMRGLFLIKLLLYNSHCMYSCKLPPVWLSGWFWQASPGPWTFWSTQAKSQQLDASPMICFTRWGSPLLSQLSPVTGELQSIPCPWPRADRSQVPVLQALLASQPTHTLINSWYPVIPSPNYASEIWIFKSHLLYLHNYSLIDRLLLTCNRFCSFMMCFTVGASVSLSFGSGSMPSSALFL